MPIFGACSRSRSPVRRRRRPDTARDASAGHPGAAPSLPNARRIDLHLHSTASDGVLSPTEVVSAAKSEGVGIIALTDHDSIGGVDEARRAGAAANVRVVAGVELSAHDADREVHVLGLHVEHLGALGARLADLADARRERAREIVERLNEVGVRIEFDDVIALAGACALGRPHVARTLVAHGWAHDHRDAFERYLLPGRPGYRRQAAAPRARRHGHRA